MNRDSYQERWCNNVKIRGIVCEKTVKVSVKVAIIVAHLGVPHLSVPHCHNSLIIELVIAGSVG